MFIEKCLLFPTSKQANTGNQFRTALNSRRTKQREAARMPTGRNAESHQTKRVTLKVNDKT